MIALMSDSNKDFIGILVLIGLSAIAAGLTLFLRGWKILGSLFFVVPVLCAALIWVTATWSMKMF